MTNRKNSKIQNYEKEFTNGLKLGERLLIYGSISKSDPNVFSLEFLHSDQKRYVLRLNANFNSQHLTRSTKINDHEKITEYYGLFPFKPSQSFEIVITVEASIFSIIINRLNVYYYSHRLPYEDIKYLKSNGDVQISQVYHLRSLNYLHAELWNQPVPFVQKINVKRNMSKKQTATTVCRLLVEIHKEAKRFEINFQYGQEVQGRYIALHFNPRWSLDENKNESNFIVFNNRNNNTSGVETRVNKAFPFQAGQMCDILFEYRKDEWLIVIDGKHSLNYAHRMSINNIDHVSLAGDVNLKLFEIADF